MTDIDWRRVPSLTALRAFEAAARLGGFAAAARALNVTHAAVAQAVRGLEADLGVTLLVRAGRGLQLTEDGARLARSLREGFATIAAGVEALRGLERGRGLRVSTMPSFAQQLLLPRLGEFWARHPDVAVAVHPSLAPVDLARDGFDLAVRIGQPPWPGTVADHLMDAGLVLVAAPQLLERGRDPARLPWILAPNDAYAKSLLAAGGLDPEALTLTGIDDPLLELSAARAGYGLLLATDAIVRDDLAAGRLVAVPFAGLPRYAYWIVTRPGPSRPAVAAFAAWLKGQFGQPPGDGVSRET